MADRKEPRWILSPEWGVDTDPLNWILYHRGDKADGTKSVRWTPVAYHKNPEQLMMALYDKVQCGPGAPNTDMLEHVIAVHKTAMKLRDDFYQSLPRKSS